MKTPEEIVKQKHQYYLSNKDKWTKSIERNPEQVKENKRRYVEKNPEKRKESNRNYHKNHPDVAASYYQINQEHIRTRVKVNAERWRKTFLEMYGGKCECCGETIEPFLTIDHIKGQKGISKKERGIESYRKACAEYRPDLYRIFCMNCNFATRHGNICPHRKV
jgi:hypothetical protein